MRVRVSYTHEHFEKKKKKISLRKKEEKVITYNIRLLELSLSPWLLRRLSAIVGLWAGEPDVSAADSSTEVFAGLGVRIVDDRPSNESKISSKVAMSEFCLRGSFNCGVV